MSCGPDYKFDLMYAKRAFIHWYVGEGMEEVSRRRQYDFSCVIDQGECRVSSPKRVKTSLPLKRTTRKSVPTLLTMKRRPSNTRWIHCYLPNGDF